MSYFYGFRNSFAGTGASIPTLLVFDFGSGLEAVDFTGSGDLLAFRI